LIAAKTKYDNDLKAAVKKDAGLTASIGDPWSQIAAVQARRKAL